MKTIKSVNPTNPIVLANQEALKADKFIPANVCEELKRICSVTTTTRNGKFPLQEVLMKIVQEERYAKAKKGYSAEACKKRFNEIEAIPTSLLSELYTGESVRVQTGEIPSFVIKALQRMFGIEGENSLSQIINRAFRYKLKEAVYERLEKVSSPMSTNGSKNTAFQLLFKYILKDENVKFETFVEPFARSASTMINYSREALRVYNDADVIWSTFFACLTKNCGKLIKEIESFYGCMNELVKLANGNELVKEFRDDCREDIKTFYQQYLEDGEKNFVHRTPSATDYKIAAKLFVVMRLAMAGDFKQGVKPNLQNADVFTFDKSHLRACAYRMRGASICCGDFAKTIRAYRKSPSAFLFIDPPYLSVKNKDKDKDYLPEFGLDDMIRLLKLLRKAECQVAFTHYADEIVDGFAKDSGLIPTFAYVSQIGNEKPTIVYMKNIQFDLDLIPDDKGGKLVYIEAGISFDDMAAQISEYFASLKKDKDKPSNDKPPNEEVES
jgi:site-specific DNA-adenine methylase